MKHRADHGKSVNHTQARPARAQTAAFGPSAAEPAPPPPVDFAAAVVSLPVPHLLVRAAGMLDEASLPDFFLRIGSSILDTKARRILLDLRGCTVRLSIADMHGLAKMIAAQFKGLVDRFALVLSEADILPEKFFEPALTSRGVPTLATVELDEATDWLASRLRPRS